jgi:hypothetical protein
MREASAVLAVEDNRRMIRIGMGIIVALVALVLGCKQSAPRNVEKPIPVMALPAAKPPEGPSNLPPPTQEEVAGAIQSIFGNDLLLQHEARSAFIAGDFNGDNSQDLAIIVRATPGKLADINSEFANWIIQDADHFFVPPSGQHVVKLPQPVAPKVTEGEELLAIIHGDGPQGWRSSSARQAYLVKHGAATLLGKSPSIAQKSIRMMHLPVHTEIIEELRHNKKGFLFWTGAQYAWHPLQG